MKGTGSKGARLVAPPRWRTSRRACNLGWQAANWHVAQCSWGRCAASQTGSEWSNHPATAAAAPQPQQLRPTVAIPTYVTTVIHPTGYNLTITQEELHLILDHRNGPAAPRPSVPEPIGLSAFAATAHRTLDQELLISVPGCSVPLRAADCVAALGQYVLSHDSRRNPYHRVPGSQHPLFPFPTVREHLRSLYLLSRGAAREAGRFANPTVFAAERESYAVETRLRALGMCDGTSLLTLHEHRMETEAGVYRRFSV